MTRTLTLIVGAFTGMTAQAGDPGIDFFEKQIRPVLVERCYECHSSALVKPKGGLSLDSAAGWRVGGESGPAIAPGKPAESRLLAAIRYAKPGLKMPPKGKLPANVIADFEKWIAMGAPDPRTGPKPITSTPPKSSITPADREFWSFRPVVKASPPTVRDQAWPKGDIDRFVLAQLENSGISPVSDAGRLTLIRRVYFDLTGEPPTPRQIDAFLTDKRPDAFARLVDDLLIRPEFGERWGRHWLDIARYADSSGGGRSLVFKDAWRYRDYVIAAFNSDTPFDRFITEQVAGDLLPFASPNQRERQVTATAFLALGPTNYERQDKDILETDVIDEQIDTIGRVFLGMTVGCARCHDHKFDPIPTRDYYALAGIFRNTQTLIHDNVSRWVDLPLPLPPEQEAEVKKHESAVAALKERIRGVKEAEKKKGTPARGIVSLKDLPGIVIDDAQATKVGAWTASKFSGSYVGDGYLHDGAADKGQKTLTFVPDFPKPGRYEVRLAYTPGANRDKAVPVTILHADGEQTFHVNQQETPAIDGHFVSIGTFRFEKGGQNFVIVSNEGTTGHVIVDAVQLLSADDKPAEKKPAPAAPKADAGLKELEAELKKLEASAPARLVAMSVKETAKIEDFFVNIRGLVHNRGPTVPRGFLQIATIGTAPAIPPKASGRRELAQWLVAPSNPLTARVMANRVWHYLFGTGLVRSVDIFGKTGDAPSHPELLDYLANRFVEQGWSVKNLIREIVLSRTYQLASARPVPADPENRLLSRMNRKRLDAECIRDSIVLAGGSMSDSRGGPAFASNASELGYKFDDTRRSIYLPVFRNNLPELFEAFDFPDPNLVSGRRNVSTVSTQALFLLNSPFVLNQAKLAAKRTLAETGTDVERLESAYRRTLGRFPAAGEKDIMLKMLDTASSPEHKLAAWASVFQALFASIDFRYVE